jgi:hypothetical protein
VAEGQTLEERADILGITWFVDGITVGWSHRFPRKGPRGAPRGPSCFFRAQAAPRRFIVN